MSLTEKQRTYITVITEAIVGILALYNLIAPNFNLPQLVIENETITSIVTAGVIVVVAIVAIWKNNNFTLAAELAQKVLDALKEGLLEPEDVDSLLENAEQKEADRLDKENQEIEEELEDELNS